MTRRILRLLYTEAADDEERGGLTGGGPSGSSMTGSQPRSVPLSDSSLCDDFLSAYRSPSIEVG